MPRKSAASLAVVTPVAFDGRPPPLDELTDQQKEIWRRVVANENAGFFNTAALQTLLAEFCRAAGELEFIAKCIKDLDREWIKTAEGWETYKDLLATRDRERKGLNEQATKLRLTNQSRYTPQAAATASKSESKVRPWQRPRSAS